MGLLQWKNPPEIPSVPPRPWVDYEPNKKIREEDHFFDLGLSQSFRTGQDEENRENFLYNDSDDPYGPNPGSILRCRLARGDLPLSDVVFVTKNFSTQGWRQWVFRVASQHAQLLKSLGIFKAIRVSSQLKKIEIDIEGLKVLLCRWCPETHTFVCSWGEFTVSLEDVHILYDLPLCGTHDLLSQTPTREEQGLMEELERIHRSLGEASFNKWGLYFFSQNHKGESTVSTLELAGFLAFWLCRHVFHFSPINIIHKRVFPLACMMACGKRFALGALYLGTLYWRMDQFVNDMIRSVGRYQVKSFVDSLFLQVFLWGRLASCRAAALRKSIKVSRCSSQEQQLFGSFAPYLWLWKRCCPKRIQANMLDDCQEFIFRPYGYGYYGFDIYHSKVVSLDAEERQKLSDSTDNAGFWLLICTPQTLPAMGQKQGEMNSIVWSPMIYSPHRVLRLFGYHQHAPRFKKMKTVEQASQALVLSCLPQLRSKLEKIRLPSSPYFGSETDVRYGVSSRFYWFWKDVIKDFHGFEKGSSDASFAIERPVFRGDLTLKLPPANHRQKKRKIILTRESIASFGGVRGGYVKGQRTKRRRRASFEELSSWKLAAIRDSFEVSCNAASISLAAFIHHSDAQETPTGTGGRESQDIVNNNDESNGHNTASGSESSESSTSVIPGGNGVDLSVADDPIANNCFNPSSSTPVMATVSPTANPTLTQDHDSTILFPCLHISSSSSLSSSSSFSSSSIQELDPQLLSPSFLMLNMTRDTDSTVVKLVENSTTPNLTDSIDKSQPPHSPIVSSHGFMSGDSADFSSTTRTTVVSESGQNISLQTPLSRENLVNPNESRPEINLKEPEHLEERFACINKQNSLTEEELLPYFKLYKSQDPSLTPQLESFRPFRRANVVRAIGEIMNIFAETPVEEVSSLHRDFVDERWEELCHWGLKLPIMEALIDTSRKPTCFDEVRHKICDAEQSWKVLNEETNTAKQSWKVLEEEAKTAKFRFEELKEKSQKAWKVLDDHVSREKHMKGSPWFPFS